MALRERVGLLESLRPCFARAQVWLQAGKYVAALGAGCAGERVERRPAGRGADARQDAAAAEPRVLG